MQIKQAIVSGCGINLEIAGMNDNAKGGMDSQRNAIHQTVRDLNWMNGEWANLEAITGTNLAQIGVVQKPMLVELIFYICQSEFCAPDWNVQFGKYPWQRADMVLMTMGEHNTAHALTILDQVGDIGNDDVHAEQFSFGEHHSGIYNDDVIAPAHGHAIHAELAKAAEGY